MTIRSWPPRVIWVMSAWRTGGAASTVVTGTSAGTPQSASHMSWRASASAAGMTRGSAAATPR